MDFVLHFLPVTYIKNVVMPATNAYAKKSVRSWKDIDFDEFLHVIGIFLAMEVHEIHGPRRLYWWSEHNNISQHEFWWNHLMQTVWKHRCKLQLSLTKSPEQHVLDFLDAIKTQFKQAVTPGSFITIDESMIGNEMKNISDGISKIVLHLEFYQMRDICDKKYVKEFGAQQQQYCCLLKHSMGQVEE